MSGKVERDGEHITPVDTLAARVTRMGPSWVNIDEVIPGPNNLGKTPLNTHRVPRKIEDLTGARKGRIKIIGYMGQSNPSPGQRIKHQWLGRCDCGVYVVRNARAWRSPVTEEAMAENRCDRCHRMESIKRYAARPKKLASRTWDRCESCGRKVEDMSGHHCAPAEGSGE